MEIDQIDKNGISGRRCISCHEGICGDCIDILNELYVSLTGYTIYLCNVCKNKKMNESNIMVSELV